MRILSGDASRSGDFFRMSGCMRFDTPIRQLMTVPVTTSEILPVACYREALVERIQSLLDRYVPGKPLASFFRWACSDGNPQQEAWLGFWVLDLRFWRRSSKD